jgi:hypothetical protein
MTNDLMQGYYLNFVTHRQKLKFEDLSFFRY